MNYLADGQSDGEPGAALALDDGRASRLRLVEHLATDLLVEARPLFQRQSSDARARPDWHHAVAMLAEEESVDLRWWHLQSPSKVATESRRVQLSPQADDALP